MNAYRVSSYNCCQMISTQQPFSSEGDQMRPTQQRRILGVATCEVADETFAIWYSEAPDENQ